MPGKINAYAWNTAGWGCAEPFVVGFFGKVAFSPLLKQPKSRKSTVRFSFHGVFMAKASSEQ